MLKLTLTSRRIHIAPNEHHARLAARLAHSSWYAQKNPHKLFKLNSPTQVWSSVSSSPTAPCQGTFSPSHNTPKKTKLTRLQIRSLLDGSYLLGRRHPELPRDSSSHIVSGSSISHRRTQRRERKDDDGDEGKEIGAGYGRRVRLSFLRDWVLVVEGVFVCVRFAVSLKHHLRGAY
jgi:hypothetical protein